METCRLVMAADLALRPDQHYRCQRFLMCYGIQFTNRSCDTYSFHHIFDRVCDENDIQHRLTKVKHPWTNGQVERMNRTIEDATVKRFYYETHDQLGQHLADFVAAYNFARRLKTLRGLNPYEFICQQWQKEPSRFISEPHHQNPGLNIPETGGIHGADGGGCPGLYGLSSTTLPLSASSAHRCSSRTTNGPCADAT